MALNLFQVGWLSVALTLLIVAIISDSPKVRIGIGLFIIVAMFFSPFRFKQEGMSSVERVRGNEFEVKERIVMETQSFEEKQANEMSKLKSDSEGMKDEIHN